MVRYLTSNHAPRYRAGQSHTLAESVPAPGLSSERKNGGSTLRRSIRPPQITVRDRE